MTIEEISNYVKAYTAMSQKQINVLEIMIEGYGFEKYCEGSSEANYQHSMNS